MKTTRCSTAASIVRLAAPAVVTALLGALAACSGAAPSPSGSSSQNSTSAPTITASTPAPNAPSVATTDPSATTVIDAGSSVAVAVDAAVATADSGAITLDGGSPASDGGSADPSNCTGPSEQEPNDTQATANPINGALCGGISSDTDVDWFTFTVPNRQTSFSFDYASTDTLDIDLIQPDGSTLAVGDNSSGNQNFRLQVGTYYVKAYSTAGVHPSYQLTVTLTP